MSIVITSHKKTKVRESSLFNTQVSSLFNIRKKLTDKQKARFYADMHMLLSSGLDINTILEIIISQTDNKNENKAFTGVRDVVVKGNSIAEAVREFGLGSDYEYYALKIGEESGKMNDVLKEIEKYYTRKIQQRRQISGAITYPVLVLTTAVMAVVFMLSVIVPMFKEIFQRFHGNLPLLTRNIINLSNWFKHHYILVFAVIIITGISLHYLKRLGKYREIMHNLSLRLPLFGNVIRNVQYARFSHTMALLSGAHIPLVNSLNLVSKMIQFIPLKRAIQFTLREVTEGKSLNISLERTGFFDKKFTSFIKASEEVNQLEYAFKKLNDQYNQEIDYKLNILGDLLEPILIVIVGALVAVILIAMYLPLFQLGTSIY